MSKSIFDIDHSTLKSNNIIFCDASKYNMAINKSCEIAIKPQHSPKALYQAQIDKKTHEIPFTAFRPLLGASLAYNLLTKKYH